MFKKSGPVLIEFGQKQGQSGLFFSFSTPGKQILQKKV